VPRLRPLERTQAPAEALSYYELDQDRYGHVLNNTKLYAYNVPVLKTMKAVATGYTETRALPLSLKSLVRVRVALINDCPFCADLHSSIGLNDGLAQAKLQGLDNYREPATFTEAERVALEYADRMTLSDQDVSDELFANLEMHYSEAEIIELTFTIAVENFFSKFHHALRVEAQGFCSVPLPGSSSLTTS
jgi:AhpD family alkylhydroperoxidase